MRVRHSYEDCNLERGPKVAMNLRQMTTGTKSLTRYENYFQCLRLINFLRSWNPSRLFRLAEDWDNVGLLVGDRQSDAKKIMTCLTITPASAAEAIECEADIIVSHHPLPFRPLKRVTTDTIPGKLLFDLIRHNVAIYSPHTAFDSAATGINQQLAQSLSMAEVQPLIVAEGDDEGVGSGPYWNAS